jgi:hypothetical protein
MRAKPALVNGGAALANDHEGDDGPARAARELNKGNRAALSLPQTFARPHSIPRR